METNKRKKRLRTLFIILFGLLCLVFYLLYESFKTTYSRSIYNFLDSLESVYPEIKIPSELFQNNITFDLNWIFYLAIGLLIIVVVCIYYLTVNSYKSYSQDVLHIINEIDNNEFTPSVIEGELSLLEEKIYSYKKRNDKLIEKGIMEKKELSEYVENIAHQIKTPIASIRLNEEVAIMSNDTHLIEKNKASFERLDVLFDNFMKLARIENDTIHFELEEGTMSDLLTNVKEHTIQILNNTELKVKTCDVKFYYDEQWLSEAIYNIIKNSVEAGVSIIQIDSYYNKEMIHIVIKDNGKGINEEDLPYIFNRFYRSRNNQKKGMGIGLSLTKEIILRHHGFISAYNEDGAVFDLSFPFLDIKEKVI